MKTFFPSPTKGAGTSSTSDYEQLTYDGGSRITQRRTRIAPSITYTYDDLGRMVTKVLPGAVYGQSNKSYSYDNLGAHDPRPCRQWMGCHLWL